MVVRLRTASAKQAFWVALVGCLALAGSNPRQAQAAASATCPDYLVIDSRGSGAPAGQTSPPGAAFASEFRKLRPGATVEIARNTYPAVGGLAGLLAAKSRIPLNIYNRSVTKGRKWLTNEIISRQQTCIKTKLYLVGLSQGAQVTGDIYQGNSFANVAGVVLFGDPRFNPHDTSAHSYGQTNLFGGLGKRRPFNDAKVQSYCHIGDPVCGWSKTSLLTNQLRMHKNYHELGEPRLAAKYFAKLEGGLGSSPPPSGPTDKWPTKKNDVSIGVSLYLGASTGLPNWMSCSPDYCIVGTGNVVLVFSLVNGVEQIGWAKSNVASPRAELAKLGIPEMEIQELLKP